ncbi:MAG: DNA (cytosine-5-)-methyltransferase [Eubacteriales bacterium]|nr:DNA (cytosine-5-)-methyltransferase [Eubacteriales bacterium]
MKFIDFFSGIGGFRLGMEMAGNECVGHCEIDKFADKSYRAMHDVKEGEWYANDITRVNPGELPEADCWCGGFPCQAFSIAGKRAGFEDMRGTLIFEVFRLAAERKPKILFLENVAGLLNHEGGRTYATILSGLWELGYDVQWQVLNSKNFGVPQNRERVFIIGHLGKGSRREIFPIGGTNTKAINQVGSLDIKGRHESACRVYGIDGVGPCLNTCGGGGLETKILLPNVKCINTKDANEKQPPQHDRVYDTNGLMTALQAEQNGRFNIMVPAIISTRDGVLKQGNETAGTLLARDYKGFSQHGTNGVLVQAVLTPDRAEKRQNGRRMKEPGEEMFTLTAQDKHGVMVFNTTDKARIRRLTPKECFRLQGFPDEYFDRAAKVNSDSQLYKQAGNSVTVNVIYEIARRL